MKQAKITYEALGDTLLIHMPKELDHHNCRDLKRDTDLIVSYRITCNNVNQRTLINP